MPTHEMLNILREAAVAVSGPIKMAWVCWLAIGVMLALARGSVRTLTDPAREDARQPVPVRRVPPRRAVTSGMRATRGGGAPSLGVTPIASSPQIPSHRA